MRIAAALLAVLILAGCGDEPTSGLGRGAAELVPPDSVAFVSVDADERKRLKMVFD